MLDKSVPAGDPEGSALVLSPVRYAFLQPLVSVFRGAFYTAVTT